MMFYLWFEDLMRVSGLWYLDSKTYNDELWHAGFTNNQFLTRPALQAQADRWDTTGGER